jgi:FkbM family methyltransferase
VQGVLRLARRLSALAAGPRARVKLFALTLELGARWILSRPSPRLREVRLRWFGDSRTFAISDYGELQVMRDIVIDEEYDVARLEPGTIVDLGANIGIGSAWFRARYPQARIIAVEPDPDTFVKLERNLGADARATLVNAAVGRESGEVTLFRPDGYSIAASVSDQRPEARPAGQVRACTLDELCAEHGLERLDLVKLDVEGAELDALDGFSRLDAVGTIVGEAHPLLIDTDEFFGRLQGFDVERLSESADSIMFVAHRAAGLPPLVNRTSPAAETTQPA